MRYLLAIIAVSSTLLAMGTDDEGGIGGVDVITGNDGTGVIIDGTQTTEEHPGSDDGHSTEGIWYPPLDTGPDKKPFDFGQCLDAWDSQILCFRPPEKESDDETDEEAEVGIPAVTITDLVRFAPDGSQLTGEPDNVGVAGLPTNFVAPASTQTVEGELFGFPISVRFTPSAYDFDYGDGTVSTKSTGGSSWIDLGQAQFTPTDTSHTYQERGTYVAGVDVHYTAEVDFGPGWLPIAGEVTADGPPQEIRIFEAHTALVAFTCAQDPDSPGC